MKAVAVVAAAASYSRPSSVPKPQRINFKFFSTNYCLLRRRSKRKIGVHICASSIFMITLASLVYRLTFLFIIMPATLLMPLTRPETAAQNPSSKSDSDSTTNKDTTNLSSLPPNMPAAVIDMIESKKDVIPVEWYNCTLTSSRFLRDTNLSKHFPRHANGRWTFSNLPECGVSIFEDYVPMIKIVPDPHPTEQAEQAEQISKIPVATSRSGCCQVQ